MTHLHTPLGDEIQNLTAGDQVYLSGEIYTARDEAHLRMIQEGIPFNPRGAVIYHCGPVIAGDTLLVAGPTTSARMNSLTKPMLDAGIAGIIGKGGMNAEVRQELTGRAVYFAFTGGCANLAAAHMTLSGGYFEDLGMAEAVWRIQLDELPLVVAMDAHGGDLFDTVLQHALTIFQSDVNGKKQG
ncbi:MAG: fumarate hydratase C-terminal domain-containing protein [Methanospirillaceae archaeon]|nr:fumarate hydratase C-terminal domain-containing protein [Methanospirillaceae archaeon]